MLRRRLIWPLKGNKAPVNPGISPVLQILNRHTRREGEFYQYCELRGRLLERIDESTFSLFIIFNSLCLQLFLYGDGDDEDGEVLMKENLTA